MACWGSLNSPQMAVKNLHHASNHASLHDAEATHPRDPTQSPPPFPTPHREAGAQGSRMHEFGGHTSVDIEKVITCHARLAGDASRDDHQIAPIQCLGELLGPGGACHLHYPPPETFALLKMPLMDPDSKDQVFPDCCIAREAAPHALQALCIVDPSLWPLIKVDCKP